MIPGLFFKTMFNGKNNVDNIDITDNHVSIFKFFDFLSSPEEYFLSSDYFHSDIWMQCNRPIEFLSTKWRRIKVFEKFGRARENVAVENGGWVGPGICNDSHRCGKPKWGKKSAIDAE